MRHIFRYISKEAFYGMLFIEGLVIGVVWYFGQRYDLILYPLIWLLYIVFCGYCRRKFIKIALNSKDFRKGDILQFGSMNYKTGATVNKGMVMDISSHNPVATTYLIYPITKKLNRIRYYWMKIVYLNYKFLKML